MGNNNNCLLGIIFEYIFNNSVSDFKSKEFVASSNIMILGSEYNTLAIDILCLPSLISENQAHFFTKYIII